MSSLYVRETVEQWLQDKKLFRINYYPTINEEQRPIDEIWFTASFGSNYREILTFCRGQQREDGEVELTFFGPAGRGYKDVLRSAELVVATLLGQSDPSEKLVLVGSSGPFEFSSGSAKKQYAVSFYIDYEYYL